MLHIPPTNLLLLAAKQEPYKKTHLLMKNIETFSGKSLEEKTSRQKKNQTKQKNKRGDSKVESNDSPEIPDRGETSDIPGLPSGVSDTKKTLGRIKNSLRFIRYLVVSGFVMSGFDCNPRLCQPAILIHIFTFTPFLPGVINSRFKAAVLARSDDVSLTTIYCSHSEHQSYLTMIERN